MKPWTRNCSKSFAKARHGAEAWLLLHVEVQNQAEADFPERMFVYYYRIYDRFRRPVVSLAVLGDENPDWRPSSHVQEELGCKNCFSFPYGQAIGLQSRPWYPGATAEPIRRGGVGLWLQGKRPSPLVWRPSSERKVYN